MNTIWGQKIKSCTDRFMQYLTERISGSYDKLKQEIPLLKWIFGSVFIWGLAAHGYMFVSDAVSHDSMAEFDAELFGNDWKISLGRFMAPIYRWIFRDSVTVVWLIGVLALLWCSLALWLLCKSYKITSRPAIVLLGGCLVVNTTFIAMTATYVNDLDQNMMALLLSVAAFYLWKHYRWGSLPAVPLLTLTLGLYQAFISVILVLVMFELIFELQKGCKWDRFFKKSFSAALMIIGGGILYALILKTVPAISGVPLLTNNYNSPTIRINSWQDLVKNVTSVYSCFANVTFNIEISRPLLLLSILKKMVIGAAFLILLANRNKECTWLHRVMIAVLCLLFPVGALPAHVLAGFSHDLMRYGICLLYAGAIVILFNTETYRVPLRLAAFVIMIVICWANTIAANNIYTRKRLESVAIKDYTSRVLTRIGSTPGYEHGKTRVVFIYSAPDLYTASGWEKYSEVVGLWHNSHVSHVPVWYNSFFKYFMHNNIALASPEEFAKYNSDKSFAEMPVFPAQGSIVMHQDVLVVRTGR